MYRAYKFRIYPDNNQQIQINKCFGCSRFVYNHYLSRIKESGYMNANACIKNYVTLLKYQYPF